MGHAVWIAAWVVGAVAFFGLVVVGMVGLTKAANRHGRRAGWSDRRVVAFTVGAAFVAFMGGWLFYLACWPGLRLARSRPRWRYTAPALSAIAMFAAVGIAMTLLLPTVTPTIVNDTGNAATLDGCTTDPATLRAGQTVSDLEVSKRAKSCELSFPDAARPYGCLYLPAHPTNDSVLRLSDYTPTKRDCP